MTFSLHQVSPTYPFKPHSIKLGANSLSYVDEGRGDAIVMLHGNPTWSYYYRNLALLLKKSYRVIVPDHLGCGLSDKPQDYSYHLEDHINNLETLLNSLDVEKISLIVHDWGGAIGMGYAVRHPSRIKSLVILNTAAFLSPRIPWRIKICRTPFLGPLLVRGFNGFAGPARFMAVKKPMSEEVARGFLAPYDSWQNRVAVCRFVQDIPLSPRDYSWHTLKQIEQGLDQFKNYPMLILWGGKDFCFNDHFYKTWLDKFPEARTKYFPEAGHYVLEDAFAEIGPLLEDFFAAEL